MSMKRLLLPPLLLAASAALAKPTVDLHSSDYVPNPAFVPLPHSPLADSPMGQVQQVGEVAILEGDDSLVSTDGAGSFGIDYNQNDPVAIAQRFYSVYPDQFDELIIFTTFDDVGAQGALAYEMSAQQDVKGLGQQLFDQSGSDGWGAADHNLHAFVNMMRWNQFTDYDGLPITDARSMLYSTLGQEFAHRWLSFLRYVDGAGRISSAMLGRDMAHWASTLQADASVMDGNLLVDNGDGSFTVAASFQRYSPLDLYGMGLLPAREVPAWFRVTDAIRGNGAAVDPTRYLRVGEHIRGGREDIDIRQVLAAEGPRQPSYEEAEHAFRVAFLLVTRPGEAAGDVTAIAETLDQTRAVWEQQFGAFTGWRGTMCTQLSAPCGSPTAKVLGGRFDEGAGANHDGIVEPGEPVTITVTLVNDGPAPATDVVVALASPRVQLARATQTLARPIAPGARADVRFAGVVPSDVACDAPLVVTAQATTAGNTFRGFASLLPGVGTAFDAPFDASAGGFGVDLDGGDTATKNGWAWGEPLAYAGNGGYLFQPGTGHDGAHRMWFTGLSRGHRLRQDSSLGVGRSTLWSPPIDLSRTVKPLLRYWLWYEAIDFSNPKQGGVTNDSIPFVVEGSTDRGATWTQLDSVTGAQPAWQQRDVDLEGLHVKTTGSLLVRFTAENPAADQLVEAGVDEVRLVTLAPACDPRAATGAGGAPEPPAAATAAGCTLAGPLRHNGFPTLAALALLLALASRRRR